MHTTGICESFSQTLSTRLRHSRASVSRTLIYTQTHTHRSNPHTPTTKKPRCAAVIVVWFCVCVEWGTTICYSSFIQDQVHDSFAVFYIHMTVSPYITKHAPRERKRVTTTHTHTHTHYASTDTLGPGLCAVGGLRAPQYARLLWQPAAAAAGRGGGGCRRWQALLLWGKCRCTHNSVMIVLNIPLRHVPHPARSWRAPSTIAAALWTPSTTSTTTRCFRDCAVCCWRTTSGSIASTCTSSARSGRTIASARCASAVSARAPIRTFRADCASWTRTVWREKRWNTTKRGRTRRWVALGFGWADVVSRYWIRCGCVCAVGWCVPIGMWFGAQRNDHVSRNANERPCKAMCLCLFFCVTMTIGNW